MPQLGRSPSSILHELRRIEGEYLPHRAQENYENKRKSCHKQRILDIRPKLCKFIVNQIIKFYWSLEQICGRLWREFYFRISSNTIYRHIYKHNLNQPFTSHGDTGI